MFIQSRKVVDLVLGRLISDVQFMSCDGEKHLCQNILVLVPVNKHIKIPTKM